MTDEELIGKVERVWTENTGLYRNVLREHERGFSKTLLKLDTATKKWVALQHRIFVTQEVMNA